MEALGASRAAKVEMGEVHDGLECLMVHILSQSNLRALVPQHLSLWSYCWNL